jgi:integrase
LLSDAKFNAKPVVRKTLNLGGLFDAYLQSLPEDALEDSTLRGLAIHRRHLERHLGVRFRIQQLRQSDLQEYIAKRSREKGIRGNKLSATTIKKEVATLRAVWNWALAAQQLTGPFPSRGLKYPITKQKPRFHTWSEIESKIAGGTLTPSEQRELWDCLFLSEIELEELLDYAQRRARHPFIYPMLVMAAHTGARRSELLRSRLSDIDDDFVTIREKKRVKGQLSTRRVPISSRLAESLTEWRSKHPGGSFTFCKSKIGEAKEITRDEANCHFRQTFVGGKWSVVRGWHCLRHSFCSNCARQGIDQRIIDSWVGHTTESMRRRYRHLFPCQETNALKQVFG